MIAPAIFMVECRICGKQRNPREFILDPIVGYCLDCYFWHRHALDLLASGGVPRGCQECGRTYEELEALSPVGDVRMAFEPKDGIYQVLCGWCGDGYRRKQLRLYANTPWGARQKLKGAK